MADLVINLPTLHSGQVKAFKLRDKNRIPARFKAIRCGRRWGKTALGATIAADGAAKGQLIGYFTPAYKYQAEIYTELVEMLAPIVTQSSKMDGVIRTRSKGRVDFWTLENEDAGRSRKYHHVIIDEAAFTKPNMRQIWERSIQPTLLDYCGKVTILSNTNGIDPDNFMWQICNDPKLGFTDFNAPTSSNPLMSRAELDRLKANVPPLVWKQEYLAEFVDWSGVQFFSLDAMLVDDRPVEYPKICSGVFAVMDSATKTGKENDGTGVIYCALSRHGLGHPLVILDYELRQIEGALLETWIPSVFERCEMLAKECGAQHGSIGVWIEDKNSGMVLLQQGEARGWPTHAIDSKLTSLGKSERAISISGYVYQKQVKLARVAFERIVNYKGTDRNHLLSQVLGFTIGSKDQIEDDLLDCFSYAVAIALGNSDGF